MTIIEKIKAEIERRIALYSLLSENTVNPNRIDEDRQLLSFLSTLESEKPMDLGERIGSYNIVPYIDDKIAKLQDMWREEKVSFDWDDLKDMIEGTARHFAQWQKEQDTREMIMSDGSYFQKCYELGKKDMKEQMMKDYPKWRRIKAGERLPCPAYVWTIAYDNYPDCFEGRLMPNIQGVKVGRDTWYLPVDVIHNLPKEDKS